LNSHPVTFHLSADNTGISLKAQTFSGNPDYMGKSSCTTCSVPAHLRKTAVGVKKTPFKISLVRRLDQYKAVGTDGHFSAANPADKAGQSLIFDYRCLIVNNDKIIAASAHFVKTNWFHNLGS
jgi:hypothetical protein